MDNSTVIEKVQKLYELAEDGGHESDNAIKHAQDLIDKYRLEEIDFEQFKNDNAEYFELELFKTPKKRLPKEQVNLASIAAYMTGVRVLINSSVMYNSTKMKQETFSNVAFFGLKSDSELAKDIYEVLYNIMKNSADKYIEEHKDNLWDTKTSIRKTFYRGFIIGYGQKLAEQSDDNKNEVLVTADDALDKAYDDKYGQSNDTKSYDVKIDTDDPSFIGGYSAGLKAEVNESLE